MALCVGLVNLCQWMWEEFRIGIAKQTLSRELRAMGYRKLSARPRHHAPLRLLKKLRRGCGPARARQADRSGRDRGLVCRRGPDRAEEQDHPTLGQARLATLGTARSTYRLNLYLRRHLPQERQGRRPRPAPLQHRRDEPASGRDRDGGGAGRSRRARPRPGRMAPVRQAHRAAEHHARPAAGQMSGTQPVENIWQFIRDNWLSNRVFRSYDDILEHCSYAWNKLVDQPWTIMSIGLRDWAHGY